MPPQMFIWQTGTNSSQIPSGPALAFAGAAIPIDQLGFKYPSITGYDRGYRIADLNGDGLPDLIQGWEVDGAPNRGAWINTPGYGWVEHDQWDPPVGVYFSGYYSESGASWDYGLRLVDLNGDGLPDLLLAFENYDGLTNPSTPTDNIIMHAWINNGGNCSGTGCAWVPA